MWFLPLIVALFPLIAAVAGGALAPDIDVPALSTEERILLGAEKDAAKRRLLDRIAGDSLPFTAYRERIAILGASLILSAFVVMALLAQRMLIQRHWSMFVADKKLPTVQAPTLGTFVAGGVILVATILLAPTLDLPGPLETALQRDIVIAVAFLAAATMTLGFVTLLGSFIIAGNFPTLQEAEAISRGFTMAKWHYGAERNRDVLAHALPKFEPGPYEMPKIGPKAALPHPEHTSLTIDPGLTAQQSIDLINMMCFVLAAAFVFTLAVLSFSGGLLATSLGGPETFSDALRAAMDGWVVFVGLGASATLAVAYTMPVLRIMPYLYAAKALEEAAKERKEPPAAKKPWKVAGSLGLKGVDVTVDRDPAPETPVEDAPKPYNPFDLHRWQIGITEERLDAIVEAARFGGAFHTLTRDTFTKHLTSVLTIIAPAAAGTILSLLG